MVAMARSRTGTPTYIPNPASRISDRLPLRLDGSFDRSRTDAGCCRCPGESVSTQASFPVTPDMKRAPFTSSCMHHMDQTVSAKEPRPPPVRDVPSCVLSTMPCCAQATTSGASSFGPASREVFWVGWAGMVDPRSGAIGRSGAAIAPAAMREDRTLRGLASEFGMHADQTRPYRRAGRGSAVAGTQGGCHALATADEGITACSRRRVPASGAPSSLTPTGGSI